MSYSQVLNVVNKSVRAAGFLALTLFSQQSMAAVSDWFATQVNADGSVSSLIDVATPLQSTSEVLRSYKQLNLLLQPEVSNALQFLGAESYNNTENLSRKIIALNDSGQASALLVTELLGMQNVDGGWGELLGYDSTAIDTAFALNVMANLNVAASEQAQSAIIYLLNSQQSDGGWHSGVNTSSVYETSLVVEALTFYKTKYVGVDNAIISATNYLLGQQTSSSLWNSTLESAHALLALTQSLSDASILKSSISSLEQKMLSNASWDNDVYITAVVTRLMSVYQKRLSSPPQSTTNGGITGTVVLAGSAEPIAGVQVSIKEIGESAVKTNSLGVFTTQSIEQGTYTLVFSKAGLTSVSAIVVVTKGKVTNVGNVALGIATTTGILTGNIFDSASQTVIANAQVSLSGAQSVSANTNQAGSFSFSNLAAGSYTFNISASGYNAVSASFNVTAGQTLLLKQGLTKVGAFLDSTPADLYGHIVDGKTGQAIVGASVNLAGSVIAVTDVTGKFTFSSIARGNYQVTVSSSNYNNAVYNLYFAEGTNGNVGKLSIYPVTTLQAPTTLTLKGRVLDGVNNLPIVGAVAKIIETSETATADTSGKFSFTNISLQSFQLEISATSYQTQTYTITVDSFGEVASDFVLPLFVAPDPTVTSSILSGIITDNKTGLPIENVDISVIGAGNAKTNNLGQYSISGITLLDFNTVISAVNYSTVTLNAKTTAFGSYTLNQKLEPISEQDSQALETDVIDPSRTTSQLSGVVTDSVTNLPIANAELTLNGSVVGNTNTEGGYSILNISGLENNLAISALEYKTKMLNVTFSGYGDFVINQKLDLTSTPTAEKFQVLNVYATQSDASADTTLRFKATVANLNASAQEGLVIAEVINASGQSITKILPYLPSTTTQQAKFSFNASETISFDFDWKVKQAPVGNYQIVVRAIVPESINAENTTGTVLAEAGTYVNVISTKAIAGVTNFDPVLAQAGTSIPVKLSALIVNQGNENLANVGFTLSIIEPSTSNIIYTTTATLDALNVQNNQLVLFGDWLPTAIGDLLVSVVPNDISVVGNINGKLYVGDKATGTFSIDQAYVPEGSPTIRAKINLQGVDTKTGTSTDPLFFAVKDAVEKGAGYVGPAAVTWHRTNGCLGCHIQTQSFTGLASSLDKADINVEDTEFLLNAFLTSQQSNGGIYLSHPTFAKVQTSLALWSLASYPDKTRTFEKMYHSARFLFDRKSVNSTETWWTSDHATGYVANTSGISSIVAIGISNVVRASKEIDLNQFPSLATPLLPSYEAELPKMARYFLNRYQDNSSDTAIHALRMSALAEIRLTITDPTLILEIDAAITFEENLLRSRQRSDGGWGRDVSRTSDPLISAMVGIALDYTNPSVDDPMVRNTIQYLLNSQLSDGSWNNNNSYFSTRLASTSFVMAYMPKALDRLGGIDVDLTIDIPSNINISNPTVVATTVTPTVDGNQYFWSLKGVTSNEQVIEFDMLLNNMLLGEQRSVASTAFMEFDNSFTSERIRVDLDIPTVTATSELTLAASINKLTYVANEDILITPIVGNTSPVTDAATVELFIRAVGSTDVVTALPPISTGNILTGGSVSLSGSWNTGGQYVGAYEVYAKLIDNQGRLVKDTVVPFSILSDGIAINSTISTDKPLYGAWDAVQLNGRIRNISANIIQPNTFVELTVKDPTDGTLLFTTFSEGQLLPVTLRDIQSSLVLTDAVSGTYSVELVVKDDFSREILTTSSTQFLVQRKIFQSLVGTQTANPTQVAQGNPTICEDTLLNRSTTGLTGVTITRQLVSIATGLVISEQSNVQDLAAGASSSNSQTIDTTNLELGTYFCILSATINGETEKLAAAGFDVLEAPIKMETTLDATGKGQLLILLANNTCSTNSYDDDAGDGSSGSSGSSDSYYSWSSDSDSSGSSGSSSSSSCGESGSSGSSGSYGSSSTSVAHPNKAYLETILNNAGWSYTIVNSRSDFKQAMRTGSYSLYALLGTHVDFDDAFEQELREAVNRGDGLLVANTDDELEKVLGIDDSEKAYASGINLTSSLLIDAGIYNFDQRRLIRTVELEGASNMASFDQLSGDDDNNAITQFIYGKGKSIYIGFDVLQQASLVNTGIAFESLLLKALDQIQPNPLSNDAGRVVPVTMKLQNLGIATPGRVLLSLDNTSIADGASIVDAYAENGNQVVLVNDGTNMGIGGEWLFNASDSSTLELVVWLRLPASVTPTLTALTQSGVVDNYVDQAVASIQLPVNTLPSLSSIAAALETLQYSYYTCKYAKYYVNYAKNALANNNYTSAHAYLLKATNQLKGLSNTQAQALRVDIDGWIRFVAAKI